jgi:hypothetical protein
VPAATAKLVVHANDEKVSRESKAAWQEPNTLVGLDPSAVGRILGRPSESHEEAIMIRWTYFGQNCALDVYFYSDIATGSFRALKYNIAGIKRRPGHGPDCINYLKMARSNETG